MTRQAPKTSLRDEQRELTRRRLLDGSRQVFSEKGYLGAKIDDLAAQAGVGRATFYLHFDTKYDVIRELFKELRPEITAFYVELDDIARKGLDLRDWMKRALTWMQQNVAVLDAVDTATLSGQPVAYDAFTIELADSMPWLSALWTEERKPELRVRIALLANQFRAAYSFMLAHPTDRSSVNPEMLADVMANIWNPALRPDAST